MTRLLLIPVLCWGVAAGARADQTLAARHDPATEAKVRSWLQQNLGELLATYKHLHAHPELSLQERETAARVAAELEQAGYRVTRGVGGHGVVGVLNNGQGPTLLIRGDMDALPVREQTGLPYASEVEVTRDDGSKVNVMHACGHDVHVTNLIGTARLLADHEDLWSGTLVIVAQPAEELGRGARAMLADGLLKRFPKPDFALALHVDPQVMAGRVALVSGWAAANVDSVDITLYGRGGHGARPHQATDPIVAASHLVTALQTLVSRRVDPQAPAVVTVGSIHGGTKRNVIPDQVELKLTVRSYSDTVREKLLGGIHQLARDTCRTFACPKPPRLSVKEHYTPAVYNDPELARAARSVFGEVLGEGRVVPIQPTMGGEDFGRIPRAAEARGLLFRLGAVAPARYRRSQRPQGPPLPSLHSSRFAPDARRTLHTAIRTMGHLALALLFER